MNYETNLKYVFRTLVDSSVERRRGHAGGRHSDPENDDTLADSIIDSMHSCADTLVGNGDDGDDATLHSCADTLHDSDEEFLSEQVSYFTNQKFDPKSYTILQVTLDVCTRKNGLAFGLTICW